MVVQTSRAMYLLSQRMDLQAYPFDEHVLAFALTSFVYNSSFVMLSLLGAGRLYEVTLLIRCPWAWPRWCLVGSRCSPDPPLT